MIDAANQSETKEFFRQLDLRKISYIKASYPSGVESANSEKCIYAYTVQARNLKTYTNNMNELPWDEIISEITNNIITENIPIFYAFCSFVVYDLDTFKPFTKFIVRWHEGFNIDKERARKYTIYGERC